jgi:hypothetical protein
MWDEDPIKLVEGGTVGWLVAKAMESGFSNSEWNERFHHADQHQSQYHNLFLS